MAAAMVSELKSTVRPAVCFTVSSAASTEPCRANSSRKTRDDQEAEVDREAQTQGDHQIEGEDRQRESHHDQSP